MMDNENIPLEKTSRTSEQSLELLEEVIEEILSRVPVKSLLRFRCVSKSWRSLIGNKRFIKTHHQNISKYQNLAQCRLLFFCAEHGVKHRSVQSYLDNRSVEPSPFDDPENNHLTTAGVLVVGHWDGVFCILRKPDSFFLWNPTTRMSRELPKIIRKSTRISRGLPKLELDVTRKMGFGWDEGSDSYIVFAVMRGRRQSIGRVYSSKTDSWKTVDRGCLDCTSYGVFTSGKIHWLKSDGLEIETFDLNSEVFGVMDNPGKPEVGESMWLFRGCKGHLSVACQRTNYHERTAQTHWVMNQYGVKESWVKSVGKTPTDKKVTCCQAVHLYIESLVSPNL